MASKKKKKAKLGVCLNDTKGPCSICQDPTPTKDSPKDTPKDTPKENPYYSLFDELTEKYSEKLAKWQKVSEPVTETQSLFQPSKTSVFANIQSNLTQMAQGSKKMDVAFFEKAAPPVQKSEGTLMALSDPVFGVSQQIGKKKGLISSYFEGLGKENGSK